jgi:hypothetical protein
VAVGEVLVKVYAPVPPNHMPVVVTPETFPFNGSVDELVHTTVLLGTTLTTGGLINPTVKL